MFKMFKKPEETKVSELDVMKEAVSVAVTEVLHEKIAAIIDEQLKDTESILVLQNEKKELESSIKKLKSQLETLKDTAATVESKKKIDELELKHLMKMSKDQMELEFQKKEMAIRTETNKEIFAIRDEHSRKFIEQLQVQADKVNEIYVQIMNRLPNVNMAIRKSVKETSEE